MQRARPIGALLAVAVCAGLILGPPLPAGAQQGGSCPSPGVGDASVDIDSPRPGTQVRGAVVVRGKISALLTVSRVELLVGRSMVDSRTFPATSSTEFSLTWDAGKAPPGPATLKVVACGQGVGGVLVEGSSTVNVEVAAPQPTTTRAAPAPSTTIGASTTSSSTPASSSTTSTSTTSTTTTSTTVAAGATPPASPGLVAAGAPLGVPGRLLPAAAEASEPRPRRLWVGLVVGLFGVAGLVFAQVLRVRRPGQKEGA